jgi:hypothetical protein
VIEEILDEKVDIGILTKIDMADVESLDPVVVEGWYHVKTF